MPKKRTGRPTIYSPELASELCMRLAIGGSLRSVCEDPKMPGITTVMRWLLEPHSDTDPRAAFRAQYARARGPG